MKTYRFITHSGVAPFSVEASSLLDAWEQYKDHIRNDKYISMVVFINYFGHIMPRYIVHDQNDIDGSEQGAIYATTHVVCKIDDASIREDIKHFNEELWFTSNIAKYCR